MLRDGMPVDVSDVVGCTALHWATNKNRPGLVKHLLNKGADVNRQDRYNKSTALHYAAQDNNTEVARLLLDNGADINLKNDFNQTPLDVARKGSEVECLLLHLQQSAS